MEIIKFEKRLIAFNFDNDMVSATDLLRSFPKKRINNFLRLNTTKAFIDELIITNLIAPKSVIKKEIGRYGGTYMHKLLAYKFAAWLNPKFELFVYKIFDQQMQIKIAKANEKINDQQMQLDYLWDKSDQKDLYI